MEAGKEAREQEEAAGAAGGAGAAPPSAGPWMPYAYTEEDGGSVQGGLLSRDSPPLEETVAVVAGESWRLYFRGQTGVGGRLEGVAQEATRDAGAAEFMATARVEAAAEAARGAVERERFSMATLQMLASSAAALSTQFCVAARMAADAVEAVGVRAVAAALDGHATSVASLADVAGRRVAMREAAVVSAREHAWREVLIAQAAVTRKAVSDADAAVRVALLATLPLPPTDAATMLADRAVRDAFIAETTLTVLQASSRAAGVRFEPADHLPPPPRPRPLFPLVDYAAITGQVRPRPAPAATHDPLPGMELRRRPGRPRRR